MMEFFDNLITYSRRHGETLAFFSLLILSLGSFLCGFLLKTLDDKKIEYSNLFQARFNIAKEKLDLEYEKAKFDYEKLEKDIERLKRDIENAKRDINDEVGSALRRLQFDHEEFVAKVNRDNKELVSSLKDDVEKELRKLQEIRHEVEPLLDEVQKDLEVVEKYLSTTPGQVEKNDKYLRDLLLARMKLNLFLGGFRSRHMSIELKKIDPVYYKPLELTTGVSLDQLKSLAMVHAVAPRAALYDATVFKEAQGTVERSGYYWLALTLLGSVLLLFSGFLGYHIVRSGE